jgi:hypothetical protein
MIRWVIDSIFLHEEDTLIIIFDPSFMGMRELMDTLVSRHYPNCKLVELRGPTRGAAETVMVGLQQLPLLERARPCMLCDGDCFFTVDIVQKYRTISSTHNGTFCFIDTQPEPLYSYVTVSPGTEEVLDIREKVKISDNANTGCYCFKNGHELEHYCARIIEAGQMQLSQDQKGEFYTSGVIKAMLLDKIPCKMLCLERNDFHVLGTPGQVEHFCRGWSAVPTIRLLLPDEHMAKLPRDCQQRLVDAMPPELHKQIGFYPSESACPPSGGSSTVGWMTFGVGIAVGLAAGVAVGCQIRGGWQTK